MATFRKYVSATGYGEFESHQFADTSSMQEIFGDEMVSYTAET